MPHSLLGFEWRKSPAHYLLLTKFLYPQDADRLARSEEWKGVLGEDPRRAIERFMKEGLVELVELPEMIDRQYTVSDLKKMLQQRSLATTGRKSELISRLIEADPEGMKRAVAGIMLIKCSPQGRQVAEEYLQREQAKRAQLEKEVILDLKRRKFRDAVLKIASYEAAQVFPRGMGVDWKHYDPSNDVEILTAIFQVKPRRLSLLTDALLENVRIAAGMHTLMWNLGQATEWLEANQPAELGVPCRVAILDLVSYARFKVEIAHLRRLGYKWVRINTCNDNHVCEACRKLSSKRYPIDKVPDLPYERCTSEACRCFIVGSLE
ncbi:MAG: SAP domain-containing protein [Synergistales bacterium]|nr:SAP domain-containing protein [Synergistales bacterium]